MDKDSVEPCAFLRNKICIAACDGLCPKLTYACIVDETCLNPPKQKVPYRDCRKEVSDVLDKWEKWMADNERFIYPGGKAKAMEIIGEIRKKVGGS